MYKTNNKQINNEITENNINEYTINVLVSVDTRRSIVLKVLSELNGEVVYHSSVSIEEMIDVKLTTRKYTFKVYATNKDNLERQIYNTSAFVFDSNSVLFLNKETFEGF
jgi:hypothetical protein